MPEKITLSVDTAPAMQALEELKPHLANVSLEVRELFFSRVYVPAKLFRFDTGATTRTGCSATLKPADLFLDLLAAARAGELQDFIIKFSHNKPESNESCE